MTMIFFYQKLNGTSLDFCTSQVLPFLSQFFLFSWIIQAMKNQLSLCPDDPWGQKPGVSIYFIVIKKSQFIRIKNKSLPIKS